MGADIKSPLSPTRLHVSSCLTFTHAYNAKRCLLWLVSSVFAVTASLYNALGCSLGQVAGNCNLLCWRHQYGSTTFFLSTGCTKLTYPSGFSRLSSPNPEYFWSYPVTGTCSNGQCLAEETVTGSACLQTGQQEVYDAFWLTSARPSTVLTTQRLGDSHMRGGSLC